jgi:hypothetical protein
MATLETSIVPSIELSISQQDLTMPRGRVPVSEIGYREIDAPTTPAYAVAQCVGSLTSN